MKVYRQIGSLELRQADRSSKFFLINTKTASNIELDKGYSMLFDKDKKDYLMSISEEDFIYEANFLTGNEFNTK